MKRLSIIAIGLSLICGFATAQNQGEYIYLNEPVIGGQNLYEASKEIGLEPGFNNKPLQPSDFFLGRISPLLVSPPIIGELGGPGQDDNGVVGSMGGAFNVTPNGAASYSIPIEVPQGINGVQPQLALTYNSQAGNGIMGFGWNLSGLSSITRTGSTIYHDQTQSGVNFDNSDHFALDGNRLFCVLGTYGENNSEYRTELETFSKIVAYRSTYNGPEYFKVYTKSGQIIEYGNSSNSRIELTGEDDVVNCWLINKITDRSGNYIEFIYNENNYNGYYYITSIKYGGNDIHNLDSKCEIKFNYRNDRQDKLIAYINPGKKTEMNCLLSDIKVYVNDVYRYTYELGYELGLSTKLKSVKRVQNDNKSLNPVDFDYFDASTFYTKRELNEITYFYFYNGEGFVYDGEKSLMSDFNGDGRLDLLVVYRFWNDDEKWAGYTLYLQGVDGQYTASAGGNVRNEEFHQFVPCNINGDQMIDLLCVYDTKLNYGRVDIEPWISTGTDFNKRPQFSLNYSPSADAFQYLASNYTGDSRSELLMIRRYNTSFFMRLYTFNLDGSVQAYNDQSFTCTDNWEYYFAKEMDFDGKNEFVRLTVDGMYIYDLVSGNPVIEDDSFYDFPTANHQIYWGDFNSDGLEDILYRDKTTGIWSTKLFTGEGYNTVVCPVTLNVDPSTDRVNYSILDYNGDGLGDIYECYLEQENPKRFKNTFFYFTGSSFSEGESFYTNDLDHDIRLNPIEKTSDLNGDGVNDLVFQDNNDNNAGLVQLVTYTIRDKDKSRLVQTITDELDNRTEIMYKHLPLCNGETDTDPEYTKQTNAEYPFMDFQGAMAVVTSVVNYDGLGFDETNKRKLKYSYEGAKIHALGKGYLGFMKATVEDCTTKTVSTNNNKIISTSNCIFVQPEISVSKITINNIEHTLSQTEYTYLIYDGNGSWGKRFASYPVQTHTKSWDEKGNFLKTTRSSTDYGLSAYSLIYGNPVSTATYTDEQELEKEDPNSSFKYSTKQTFQYKYTWYDKWLIGLIERVDVVSQTIGQAPVTSFKEIIYYEPAAPLFPALIHFEKNNTGSALELFTEYQYDNLGLGLITSKTISSPNYVPPFGLPTLESRTEAHFYNPLYGYRFLSKTTNALNHSAEKTIDPISGNISEAIDANGFINKYYYDSFGRLIKTVNFDGIQSAKVLRWASGHEDASSNAIYYEWTASSGTKPSIIFYDRLGREVRQVSYTSSGQKVYVEKQYNHNGMLVSVSEPHLPGQTDYLSTITEYDDLGRAKIVTAPGNIITNFSYGLRSTTVTNHFGNSSVKNYNAPGWLISSIDEDSKTVSFTYYSDGKVNTSKVNGLSSTLVTYEYDINGNKKKTVDPSWGIIDNLYNPYGELIYTCDARGNKYKYIYDRIGRLIQKVNINNNLDITSWDYDDPNKLGLLIQEGNLSGHSKEYEYGQFNRISSVTETISGNNYQTFYTYDVLGRQETMTYPDGLVLRYGYDFNTGSLSKIKRERDNSIVWQAIAYNKDGQLTESRIGGYSYVKTYFPETGLLKSTISPTIQSFEYAYDALGNMTDRYDHLHKAGTQSLHEHFTYDDRNQLLDTYKNGLLESNIQYDLLGNITSKTSLGTLRYLTSNKPYQLSEILTTAQTDINYKEQQDITYTDFNKVKTITGNGYVLKLEYGLENQRMKQGLYELTQNGENLLSEKTFISGLIEKINYSNGSEKSVSYITSPEGLVAVEVTLNDIKEWYWIFTDHLGSITSLVRERDGMKFEMSFDAWGNRRDPATWVNYTTTLPEFIIDRGFTGHEHLDVFNLINMNGRVYDPVASRFLSPDSYIPSLELAQNYNGYIYCLNNPLIYSDPDGNLPILVPIIIGVAAGAYTGYKIAEAKGYDLADLQTYGYMLGGAVIGGLSGYAGATIAAGGGFMSNTFSIAYSSTFNSLGMANLSTGDLSPSISLGFGSYNFGSGKFTSIFNWGNINTFEKIGYTFGTLANIQDIVAGFHGTTVEVKSRPEVAGHSESTGSYNGEQITISIGPGEGIANQKIDGALGWEWEYVKKTLSGNSACGENESYIRPWEPQITTKINNINGKWLLSMTKRLDANMNLLNSGPLKYGLFQGCVNFNARALLFAGVPNINAFLPITAPVLLNAELAIRQVGIYASPYLTH